jgi:hypothetical protein
MWIRIGTNLFPDKYLNTSYGFFSSHRLNIDSRCGAAETTVIVRYSFKILKSQSIDDLFSCTTFFCHLV